MRDRGYEDMIIPNPIQQREGIPRKHVSSFTTPLFRPTIGELTHARDSAVELEQETLRRDFISFAVPRLVFDGFPFSLGMEPDPHHPRR